MFTLEIEGNLSCYADFEARGSEKKFLPPEFFEFKL
jgi:hypothetical protein